MNLDMWMEISINPRC